MSKPKFADQFEQLPLAAQKQVIDFIAFLYERHVKAASKGSPEKSIAACSFVGIWKDREDMADSAAWVKRQRSELWSR